jgi:co-chaperonin GroES (HSP10)
MTGAVALAGVVGLAAQTPAAPHAAGTVKSTADGSITVTTATGDATVTIPATAKILDVPPGSKDLKAATPGQMSDIAVGDKVIVNGSAGDTATALTAQRVILMKAAAIEQSHAADEAAWKNGGGGIVKSVNAGAGTILLSSGLKTVTVQTSPATIVRHYANGSVKFEDAMASSLGAIMPGDQLRVRGAKSADGSSIQADEIVAGTFRNFSGLIASIDGTTGTVTLKDLTTKKTVSVSVTANSDIRRIPLQAATMMAARMHAKPGEGAAAGAPAAAPAGGDAAEGQRRAGRAGMDLSQMLARLPTETLAGLKTGDAVMIVATSSGAQSNKESAITLLAGVEPILAAQPEGQAMTLSPWSMGSAPEGAQ